jgi:hypothetical protein
MFELVDKANEICPNNKSKKASECVFKRIVDILAEVGNPALHAYRFGHRCFWGGVGAVLSYLQSKVGGVIFYTRLSRRRRESFA